MNILVRQNVAISDVLDAEGTFSQNININFIPDIMNVKIISYRSVNSQEPYTSKLYTDITNEIIGPISDGDIAGDCYTKEIYKPITGIYTFKVLSAIDSIDTGRAGTILLMLEFIKYKN